MTREQAKELLPIIQGFAEGKTVQIRSNDDPPGVWYDASDPSWRQDHQYRLKPEPREIWVNEYPDGALGLGICKTQEESASISPNAARQVKFREVIE